MTCSALRHRPSAASHYFLGLPQQSPKSSGMNTYKKCVRKPFRMNTYKTLDLKSLCFQHLQKIGGGGRSYGSPESMRLHRGSPELPHSFTLLQKSEKPTPVFSIPCALLLLSFVVARSSSPSFSIACALFAKTRGVYPNYSLSRGLLLRDQNGIRDRLRQNSRGSFGPSPAIFSSPG